MKIQIHLPSAFLARRGNARSYSYRRGGACPGLLLACCCALLVGPPWPTRAAVTEAWVHRYSNVASNANDRASKVVSDAAGDIIVTGVTDDLVHGQDMLTIKYSGADGTVLWQQRYNGSANRGDYATALAVDGDGNVVVAGYSYSNNGTNNDHYTAKYAAANGTVLWEQRHNGGSMNSDHQAPAVAVDGSGNVVVTGSSDDGPPSFNADYYTAKYAAATGVLLWEKRYNGPANGTDFPKAVVVDGSGNVVVTGYSGSFTSGGGWDYYTAKYAAATGALLWEQRYNGPKNKSDYSQAVAVDAGGNVVVTGYSENNGSTDNYTAKYAAANGALVWEKRSKNQIDRVNPYDRLNAVAVDDSGNVIVTGHSYGGVSGYSYYTAKYGAADGALLWEQRSECGLQAMEVVAVDGSGNVVVTGSSLAGDNDYYGFYYYTVKYASLDGALLWEQRFNSPASEVELARAAAVAVDVRGNVVVIGTSNHGAPNHDYDYYTAKYAAADGALLWEQRYNGPANGPNSSKPWAAGVDGSGNVVVTGAAWNSDLSLDYYTAKYASLDGALLWQQRHTGPGYEGFSFSWWYYDGHNALAVDSSGNVVMMGRSRTTNLTGHIFVAKYAAADGVLLWENRHNLSAKAKAMAVDGSGYVVLARSADSHSYIAKYAAADGALLWEQRHTSSYPPAVAVAASGNVVVTGNAHNANFQYYYTAQYAAADGALLWDQRHNGAGRGIAVDVRGNVVVIGSYNNGGPDYYTAKYAAADGALLWEQRHTNSYPTAVVVAASGNVVVTGYAHNANFNTYYYTAQYAAADGALLWEQRHNGSMNSDDQAPAVAVDGSGNVVVTGSSDDGPPSFNADYYTAKYAAADGALLWERRYNGPANGDDRGTSLALGPNGMVAVTGSSIGSIGSNGAYDYATVVYRESLPAISIERVPTGVRFRFTGIPGRGYTIERAPTITGPWTTLAAPTAPIGGLVEYTDTHPPSETAFYRTSAP